MRSIAKFGIVFAGYITAVAVACAVLQIYIASTAGPDREQYAAMFAFGDSLLFLGVFTIAALPATGAALFFLRPYRPFWTTLSIVAMANAATGVASGIAYSMRQLLWTVDHLSVWPAFAVLRLLVAPALAPILLLCACFAPTRSSRLVFAATAVTEIIAFMPFAIMWFSAAVIHRG